MAQALRQITHGGVQEWPVGWLPGGFLYTVPGREYEYIVYRLDLASGESQVFSNDENIQSLSPDGQYVAIANLTFGERWAVDISRLDGADRWALANDGLWVLNPCGAPDGEWLLATVSATDSGFYHRRADQPAHLPGHLPAASGQPPRLETIKLPFIPEGWGSGGRFAPRFPQSLFRFFGVWGFHGRANPKKILPFRRDFRAGREQLPRLRDRAFDFESPFCAHPLFRLWWGL